MRLLLDTHVVLWWFGNLPIISAKAKEAISDPGNSVFVSTVVAWEVSIKKALGKLDAPDDFKAKMQMHRFEPLPIEIDHALAVVHLPHIHSDPFDRMLVAQARAEKLTIVTRDKNLPRYEVATLMA